MCTPASVMSAERNGSGTGVGVGSMASGVVSVADSVANGEPGTSRRPAPTAPTPTIRSSTAQIGTRRLRRPWLRIGRAVPLVTSPTGLRAPGGAAPAAGRAGPPAAVGRRDDPGGPRGRGGTGPAGRAPDPPDRAGAGRPRRRRGGAGGRSRWCAAVRGDASALVAHVRGATRGVPGLVVAVLVGRLRPPVVGRQDAPRGGKRGEMARGGTCRLDGIPWPPGPVCLTSVGVTPRC